MLDFTTGDKLDTASGDAADARPADSENKKTRDGTAVSLQFNLDGREYEVYKPKKWHWSQMAAGLRPDAEAGDQFYAIDQFMKHTMEGVDRNYLRSRLDDRDDALDLDDLMEIFNQLIDAWGPEMRKEFDAMGARAREDQRRTRAAERARQRSGDPRQRSNITVVSGD